MIKHISNVLCDTDILGGSFWWDNVIKDNRAVGHLGIDRIDNSHTKMYGKLYSAGTYEVK